MEVGLLVWERERGRGESGRRKARARKVITAQRDAAAALLLPSPSGCVRQVLIRLEESLTRAARETRRNAAAAAVAAAAQP